MPKVQQGSTEYMGVNMDAVNMLLEFMEKRLDRVSQQTACGLVTSTTIYTWKKHVVRQCCVNERFKMFLLLSLDFNQKTHIACFEMNIKL